MGVELTHDFADDLGGFAGGAIVVEPQLAHSEQDTAMDGFQTITDIGQRATDDDRHRVVEIGLLHLVFDVDRDMVSIVVA